MILALGNPDHVLQFADRRLTAAGRVVDEEAGKAGVLVCLDSRMLFGFTGLSRVGDFEARRWLLDALYGCSLDDHSIHATLERLKDRATKDFNTIPALRALSPSDRRFGILFTGYVYTREPPLIGSAIVSNFLDPAAGAVSAVASDHFQSFYTTEKKPRHDNATYVQRIGVHRAMRQEDVDTLRAMLADRRPAEALTGKATEMMLAMADRDAAGGAIGKQITWLRIVPARGVPTQSGYYSNVPTRIVYTPTLIVLDDEHQAAFDMGSAVLEGDDDSMPLVVPKVGRNVPCPCRSGRKYKHCHGR
jgi:hypothetical protein